MIKEDILIISKSEGFTNVEVIRIDVTYDNSEKCHSFGVYFDQTTDFYNNVSPSGLDYLFNHPFNPSII